MAYYGKVFTFEKEENFSTFMDALKIPIAEVSDRMSAKKKLKLEKNGDLYTYSSENLDGSKPLSFSFKSGDTLERNTSPDRKAFITFTVDGNTLIQSVTGEDRAKTLTIKKEFSSDSVKETYSSSSFDAKAVRYYKA